MKTARLLFVSAGVNLVLIGLVAGVILSGHWPQSRIASEGKIENPSVRSPAVRDEPFARPLPPGSARQKDSPVALPQARQAAIAYPPPRETISSSPPPRVASLPPSRSQSAAATSISSGVSSSAPPATVPQGASRAVVQGTAATGGAPASFSALPSGPSSAGQPLNFPSGSEAVTPVAGPAPASLTGDIDPSDPGNSFAANGQRVSVENAETLPNGDQAMDFSVAPDEASLSKDSSGEWSTGFTYEQELFRAKWGWAAFSEAQRAAWELSR